MYKYEPKITTCNKAQLLKIRNNCEHFWFFSEVLLVFEILHFDHPCILARHLTEW